MVTDPMVSQMSLMVTVSYHKLPVLTEAPGDQIKFWLENKNYIKITFLFP